MRPADLLQTGIRETYRIDHPAAEVRYSRSRIPLPRLYGDGLGDQPTDEIEVDDLGQLLAVTGCA
jgi:hypothetical protein